MTTLDSLLHNCASPRVVYNLNGLPVLTTCGRCAFCMSRKSKRHTFNTIQESAESTYCYFITLKYNDANIPIIKLVEDKHTYDRKLYYKPGYTYVDTPTPKHFIRCIDYTRRKLHPRIKKSRYVESPTYNQELFRIHNSFKDKLFNKFYKKAHVKSKIFKRKPFKYLSVLSKRDLQNFIKRLRFQISEKFDAEVRYFACGEYGPKHFRPHYHILLFFNEPKLQTELQKLVYKCWQYGSNDVQPVRSRNGVARYAAGYVNGTSHLPSFYYNKQIAPFVCHSNYLGAQTNDELLKYVEAFDFFPFESFDVSVSTGIRRVSLLSSVKSYLFPRCFDYVGKVSRLDSKLFKQIRFQTLRESTEEFYRLNNSSKYFLDSYFKQTDFYKIYNLFPYLSNKYKTTRVALLSRYFLLYERDLHYLLDTYLPFYDGNISFLEDSECYSGSNYISQFSNLDLSQFELVRSEIDDYHISILDKVGNTIRVSRRVFSNSQNIGKELHDYLYKIIDFYNQLEQYKLKCQYELQNQFAIDYTSEDYTLFYYHQPHLSYNEFQEIYNNSPIIRDISNTKLINIMEKVKHKELNDLNEIFTNL